LPIAYEGADYRIAGPTAISAATSARPKMKAHRDEYAEFVYRLAQAIGGKRAPGYFR
jgi:hypothetical protein